MGLLTTFSWRKTAVLAAVAAVLTGLAFAVRYGEDNQVGSSNVASWWVFVAAGVFAYWALLGLAVSLFRTIRRRHFTSTSAEDSLPPAAAHVSR